jgi:hypothetical protein
MLLINVFAIEDVHLRINLKLLVVVLVIIDNYRPKVLSFHLKLFLSALFLHLELMQLSLFGVFTAHLTLRRDVGAKFFFNSHVVYGS